MKCRKEALYDVVAPTSMGLRMAPDGRQQISISNRFTMQATSAESNVLSVPAALGCRTKVLTAFVKGSPISGFIRAQLRARGIAYEGPERESGGPWGLRHQINFAESGFGVRGARVYNDRAGEVGRTLDLEDFDLEKLFVRDGVKILHMSGLIAALSPQTGKFCLELARMAKQTGTLISFDMNYRESFWKGRQEELTEIFSRIASEADILMNFQPMDENGHLMPLALDPERPGTFRDMLRQVRARYPDAYLLTSTIRGELDAGENLWGAVMLAGEDWYTEEPRRIAVLDRIGGGDGFASGVLYGILRGYEPGDWIRLGWACGAMAVTTPNDYAQPDDEQMLRQIYSGNARISR